MVRTADGFRIYKPTFKVNSAKVAYGLECIRIWSEDQRIEKATGKNPNSYIPTEEEFMEARKVFGRGRR